MIPIRLTLQGIYSYREKQTIEFEPLTSAGIFGIFGSVGSGKSTILEAISFALFGEIERLNKRDERAYNMMNLKSNELFIDFIFKTGAAEQEYRYVVKGKRNRKHFEKVNTYDRSAYKKVNNDWEPVDVNDTENILQLSYENFRRTIIIPQGKFQEFLELTDSERTRMMKELFHLQRFELFDKAVLLEQGNKDQRIRLEERLQQTGNTTAEEITAKEEEWETIRQQVKFEQQTHSEKQTAEQSFNQLKLLFERIAAQKETLFILTEQEAEMKMLEQQINQYEFCFSRLKPLFDKRNELEEASRQQKETLAQQEQQLLQINEQLSIKEKRFPAAKLAFENRTQLQQKKEELEKIIQLNQLTATLQQTNVRLENGNGYLQQIADEINALQEKKDAYTIQLQEWKQSLADTILLTAISNWFVQQRAYSVSLKKIVEEQKKTNHLLELLSERKRALLTPELKAVAKDLNVEDATPELLKKVKTLIVDKEPEIQKQDAALQELLLKQGLEEYAAQLKPGEPCPLCGATDHPQVITITHVKKAAEKLKAEKKIIQQQFALLQNAFNEWNNLLEQEQLLAYQAAELKRKHDTESELIKEHEAGFVWTGYQKEDEAEIKKQLEQAGLQQKRISDYENKLRETELVLKEKLAKQEMSRQKLEELKSEVTTLTANNNLLKGQLKILNADDYLPASEATIQKEISQLKETFAVAETEFNTLDRELQQLRLQAGALNGSMEAGRTNAGRTQLSLQAATDQIQKVLKVGEIEEMEANGLLASGMNLSEARQRLQNFHQQLHTTKQLLAASEKETSGKNYDAQKHAQLISELEAIKTSVAEKQEQAAGLAVEISNAKKQLVLRASLSEELNRVVLRGNNIDTLKNLLKGSGFVNYVSSVHLQQLCNAANERFYKLTRQQLRLEINESNNFLVRDYMNNGQPRSVKTLSGGQKFQAALSLALALADSIQLHAHAKQNFFFLDEGFGSLDSDSLDMVFETLRTLRKENRIVGIISHVKEMQQEIDTCLTIVNDEELGSRIFANW